MILGKRYSVGILNKTRQSSRMLLSMRKSWYWSICRQFSASCSTVKNDLWTQRTSLRRWDWTHLFNRMHKWVTGTNSQSVCTQNYFEVVISIISWAECRYKWCSKRFSCGQHNFQSRFIGGECSKMTFIMFSLVPNWISGNLAVIVPWMLPAFVRRPVSSACWTISELY